jgi:hypothetical protein
MVCRTWRGGTQVLYATCCKKLFKDAEKSGKKEDNFMDDFRRRLWIRKKSCCFIERWWMLRRSNKKVYDFLKKSEED